LYLQELSFVLLDGKPVNRLVATEQQTIAAASNSIKEVIETSALTLSAEQTSDEILMSRVCEGDGAALESLFDRHARLIRVVACRIVRDNAEAEDLVQDLFLFIQRKCRIFDESKSSAKSWIVQMTYRRAIERRRYLTTRSFYRDAKSPDELESVVASPTGESDYSPEIVFGRNGLKKVIDEMSHEQKETLRLYFFDGYTLSEISEKLGQSLGNVRHYYYRGLDQLRKEMFRRSVRES
jgi:RNA polymerase sigma-70 factor, ECF subfamily